MARPHPVLVPLASGRSPGPIAAADDGLLRSALDHGMHGLLWTWVREHAPDYRERVRLASIDAATRRHHDRLWATLAAVRDRLATLDVEVMALKGVTAEARWYTRPGERPTSDVDVLVRGPRDGRAGDIVRLLDPGYALGAVVDDLVRAGVLQSVDLRVDGVPVDLHFDLLKLGYPMRDLDAVWRGASCVTGPDGTTVPVLGEEAALVHFLVHANKDSFPRLVAYADVVRVAGRDDLDWDVVGRILRDEGLDDVAACALTTIARAVDVPVDRWPERRGLRTRLWHVTWPERATLLGTAGPARSRRQEALPFLVRGRVRDALRAAARVLLPPRVAVHQRYADVPGPYVVRLARGRLRTARARRAALGGRQLPGPSATDVAAGSGIDGTTKARLLRARLAHEPVWLVVSGRSMGRSIPDGCRVRVVTAASPRRGEVWAVCAPDGAMVVHRVRRATGGGWVLHGDACARADAPVDDDRLIGKVVAVDPTRDAWRWGAGAGAVQRAPRVAVARVVRTARRVRVRARGDRR